MDENRDPMLSRIEQSLLETEASLRRSAAEVADARRQISHLPYGTHTSGPGAGSAGTHHREGDIADSHFAGNPPTTDERQWLTLVYAAQMANVHRATIGRQANMGKVIDNDQKGKQRRVLKASLLQWMGKRVEQQRQREFAKYDRDLDGIPEQH